MVRPNEEIDGYIYTLTNTVNGKVYVGQTFYAHKRYLRHLRDKQRSKNPMYDDMKLYGKDKFEFHVEVKIHGQKKEVKETLCELEKVYVDKFNSFAPNGYNRTLGGQGTNGCKFEFSDIHKKRLSLSMKGREPWNKGHKYGPEFRQKVSDSVREFYKNHSTWNKGMKMDFDFCKRTAEGTKNAMKKRLENDPSFHTILSEGAKRAATGTTWMNNPATSEQKRVHPEDIDSYKAKGFVLGRGWISC